MTILSFNFNEIIAKKATGVKGKIKISNNMSIKGLEEFDLKLGKKAQKALKIKFLFEAKYEPKLGEISLGGELIYLNEEKKVKEIQTEWKKNKSIPKDVMPEIMGHVLKKCNIESLVMSREINLPSPIPLPKVNIK